MDYDGIFVNLGEFEATDKSIGGGSLGDVIVVKEKKGGHEFACKTFKSDKFSNPDIQMSIVREAISLHQINHPAIIKLRGFNLNSFNDQKLPCIITEYIPTGSLHDVLEAERAGKPNPKWNDTKKIIAILGICHGMKNLHSLRLVHGDLKPSNILLDEKLYPHVCDVGFPLEMNDSIHRAPDNLLETPVDLYSYAIICYEIITGKLPYSELTSSCSTDSLLKKVQTGTRPRFPPTVTEKMKKLIESMWSRNPNERPSFEQVYMDIQNYKDYIKGEVDANEVDEYIRLLSASKLNDSFNSPDQMDLMPRARNTRDDKNRSPASHHNSDHLNRRELGGLRSSGRDQVPDDEHEGDDMVYFIIL